LGLNGCRRRGVENKMYRVPYGLWIVVWCCLSYFVEDPIDSRFIGIVKEAACCVVGAVITIGIIWVEDKVMDKLKG